MSEINKFGQQSLNIADTKPVVCEKCGGEIFAQGLMLREVSAILTGTGKPGAVPIPVFYCVECKHVNKMFVPEELRKTEPDRPKLTIQED